MKEYKYIKLYCLYRYSDKIKQDMYFVGKNKMKGYKTDYWEGTSIFYGQFGKCEFNLFGVILMWIECFLLKGRFYKIKRTNVATNKEYIKNLELRCQKVGFAPYKINMNIDNKTFQWDEEAIIIAEKWLYKHHKAMNDLSIIEILTRNVSLKS